jgi:SanA protein
LKKKLFKRILQAFALLVILAGLSIPWANHLVLQAAKDKTWSRIEDVTPMRTGLLLGTSKFMKNGWDNEYFTNRIKAAAELFTTGKIKYLVISGDNSSPGYNEPVDMRTALIARGIDSTRIYLDYAGFRTFDSMVRVKEIFGQDTILVISQKFHNERAIYIAQKLQIVARGYNAEDVNKYLGFRTALREKFARVKVVLDFMTGVKPRFLGPRVKIG